MKYFSLYPLLLLLFLSHNAFERNLEYTNSTPENWELIKDKNDIKVYVKRHKNDFSSIRIKMKIFSNLKACVDYMDQIDKFTEWIYGCIETKEIYRNKDFFIYYTITDMPYPFYDRILTLKSEQILLPKYFEAHSYSMPTENLKNDYVIVPHFECHWFINEISPSLITIDYEAKTDPGGAIPAWLYNMGIDIGPYRSMLNLKQILENSNDKI